MSDAPTSLLPALRKLGFRAADDALAATERRLRMYERPDLLILDELGYLPCDTRAADMFYSIIAARHERRATVISTNMAYKQWAQLFQGAPSVPALVDRFAQHCHVLDIDTDSWRLKHGSTE
jgi:DNA replication protein DnaC